MGFEARRLEFWGALCYLVGVALFFVGLIALIINDCPGHLLPTLTYVSTSHLNGLLGCVASQRVSSALPVCLPYMASCQPLLPHARTLFPATMSGKLQGCCLSIS